MPTSALSKSAGILRADVGIGPYEGVCFNRVNNNLQDFDFGVQRFPQAVAEQVKGDQQQR
jgi:hypothetical protein